MNRLRVRIDSATALAEDREQLRATLIDNGAQPSLASHLVRVVHELATNGFAHGEASIVEIAFTSLDEVWVRIDGGQYDSVSALSGPEASGLADAAHLLGAIGWEWSWSWEQPDALSSVAASGSSAVPRPCNALHLRLRIEEG